MPPIILASASPFRRMLLDNAGIVFRVQAAMVDERAIEAQLAKRSSTAGETAQALADAKALAVSADQGETIVVGSDQTLSLADRVFHKPQSRDEAREHIRSMSGRTHQLNSAVALARNGSVVWRHLSIARLTMRPISDAYLERYLERAGDKLLGSVGAYQLEREGINLFERIDGDYFTILGLPMLPLLAELRRMGAIDG